MDADRQCTATSKQSGERCKRYAIPGGTTCKIHGSGTQAAKAAAARRVEEQAAQQAVVTLGLPRDISPTEALLEEVRWTAGHVHWLRQRVQELEAATADLGHDDGETATHSLVWGTTKVKTGGDDAGTTAEAAPSVWYVLYERERKHLVAVASAALKAGVEERKVRLAESQGELVSLAIKRILGGLFDHMLAAGMQAALHNSWSEGVTAIVPRELRRLAGGDSA